MCRSLSHLYRLTEREKRGWGRFGPLEALFKGAENNHDLLFWDPPPPGYPPLGPAGPYKPGVVAPSRPYKPCKEPPKNFTKCPVAMHFRQIFVSRGGGRKFLTRKIIYRKIFLRQNRMLTSADAKRGRWVYEGGEAAA